MQHAQHANPLKEQKMVNNNQPILYTEDQLMARLKFFVGVCLALTLTGIVFVVLYSIIFVTQPLDAMSPIDQKFFELIVPIATFLTGTLSGIMLAGASKEDKEAMLNAQKQATESFKSTMEEVKKPMKVEKTEPTFAIVPMQGQVVTGYGGKLAPPPAQQPEL
jgi:hypothetical protein